MERLKVDDPWTRDRRPETLSNDINTSRVEGVRRGVVTDSDHTHDSFRQCKDSLYLMETTGSNRPPVGLLEQFGKKTDVRSDFKKVV